MRPGPVLARRQRGVSLFVVLILSSVMMLAGLAVARITEAGTLVSGNIAAKERALHASEVGVNTAYGLIQSLPDDQQDSGNWYFSRMRNLTAEGLPDGVDWDLAPEITVGNFSVRYVAERMCSTSTVTDPLRECFVAEARGIQSGKVDAEALEPPSGKQFRVTVKVSGPRNTLTFVQALVTGSSS